MFCHGSGKWSRTLAKGGHTLWSSLSCEPTSGVRKGRVVQARSCRHAPALFTTGCFRLCSKAVSVSWESASWVFLNIVGYEWTFLAISLIWSSASTPSSHSPIQTNLSIVLFERPSHSFLDRKAATRQWLKLGFPEMAQRYREYNKCLLKRWFRSYFKDLLWSWEWCGRELSSIAVIPSIYCLLQKNVAFFALFAAVLNDWLRKNLIFCLLLRGYNISLFSFCPPRLSLHFFLPVFFLFHVDQDILQTHYVVEDDLQLLSWSTGVTCM